MTRFGIDPRAPAGVDTTAADEQDAIDAGAVKGTRIDWAGSRR
jgi:hypothetical protein